MQELRPYLDDLWRWKCDIPEETAILIADLEELKKTEWSVRFERLMRNRLIMGAIRYGRLNAPGKPKYDRVKSMIKRLNLYEGNGNIEVLVDVANLCLCEFEEGNHPLRHFHAVDDGEHASKIL
ncbi:MAG: hypothetical protein ACOYM0_01140 [Bacteroidales bacterium]